MWCGVGGICDEWEGDEGLCLIVGFFSLPAGCKAFAHFNAPVHICHAYLVRAEYFLAQSRHEGETRPEAPSVIHPVPDR